MKTSNPDLLKIVEKIPQVRAEIAKAVIGQKEVVDELLLALFAGGHALLEGVPGVGKTLLIQTLSQVLDLDFKRVQFTPDLMPGDILGTEILKQKENGNRYFEFRKGPIFTNLLLADEINRTPPKTQAALLEAMQEKAVTYAGKKHELSPPFFIMATQNPIEQAGTFPLPEAQLDRFLLYIKVPYPTEAEETAILELTTKKQNHTLAKILNKDGVIAIQEMVKDVFIDSALVKKVTRLVRNTRPQNSKLSLVKEKIEWGAGPRAGQALILTAKANALMNNRVSVIPEDLQKVVFPALRHRLTLNFSAEAEGLSTDAIIQEILTSIDL